MRYNNLKKQELVSWYYNGKSVTEICEENQISSKHLFTLGFKPIGPSNPKQFSYRHSERL